MPAGPDNRTAYERFRGRKAHKHLPEFGEGILYMPEKQSLGHGGVRKYPGILLGVRERSEEIIVGEGEEVIRARDYSRRPASEQWCAEEALQLKASTSAPNMQGESLKIKCVRRQVEHQSVDRTVGHEDGSAGIHQRSLKLRRPLLERYGYTAGCPERRNGLHTETWSVQVRFEI